MADRAPDLARDYDLPRVVRDHMIRWVRSTAARPPGLRADRRARLTLIQ